MIRDGINCDDNLAWVNPCFTYNDNRELNYLNFLDGNLTTGIRGSKYDMGFGNMNCRFGTSVGTIGEDVLVGASNHMYQGKRFEMTDFDWLTRWSRAHLSRRLKI